MAGEGQNQKSNVWTKKSNKEHTVMWAADSPNNTIKNHKTRPICSADYYCTAATGWAGSANAELFLFNVNSGVWAAARRPRLQSETSEAASNDGDSLNTEQWIL